MKGEGKVDDTLEARSFFLTFHKAVRLMLKKENIYQGFIDE